MASLCHPDTRGFAFNEYSVKAFVLALEACGVPLGEQLEARARNLKWAKQTRQR